MIVIPTAPEYVSDQCRGKRHLFSYQLEEIERNSCSAFFALDLLLVRIFGVQNAMNYDTRRADQAMSLLQRRGGVPL